MIQLVDVAARVLAGPRLSVGLDLPRGVEVRSSRLVPWLGGKLARLRGPAAAVTLGRMILVHPSVRPDERLIRHELAHVAQWTRAPVTFPFAYVRAHIRHGYHQNPYETEARAAEGGAGPTGEMA